MRYSSLCEPFSSSCGGLWPSTKVFFTLWAIQKECWGKKEIMPSQKKFPFFYLILNKYHKKCYPIGIPILGSFPRSWRREWVTPVPKLKPGEMWWRQKSGVDKRLFKSFWNFFTWLDHWRHWRENRHKPVRRKEGGRHRALAGGHDGPSPGAVGPARDESHYQGLRWLGGRILKNGPNHHNY